MSKLPSDPLSYRKRQRSEKTMIAVPLTTVTQIQYDYSQLRHAAAKIARQAADRIRRHKKAALIEIGRELHMVKSHLTHGQFLKWVEIECAFSRRTASNMMLVATRFNDKWETVSHLPPTLLYKLAARSTPEEFLQQVFETPESQRITPASLKASLIARRKQEPTAKRHPRSKELTKGQAAYAKRKQKQQAEASRRIEARRSDERQKAVVAAKIVYDALGDNFSHLLKALEEVNGYDLISALRKQAE